MPTTNDAIKRHTITTAGTRPIRQRSTRATSGASANATSIASASGIRTACPKCSAAIASAAIQSFERSPRAIGVMGASLREAARRSRRMRV